MTWLGAFLKSRQLLGLCALALAVAAVRGDFTATDVVHTQSTEQECRAARDAALNVEVAKSLLRIELAQRERADGDWQAALAVLDRPQADLDAYQDAIDQAQAAVTVCG